MSEPYLEDEIEKQTALMVKDNFDWLQEWWMLQQFDSERDAIIEAFRLSQCRDEDQEYPLYQVNGVIY